VVPLLRAAMREHLVTGELYSGDWNDIGTVDRLRSIRAALAAEGAPLPPVD